MDKLITGGVRTYAVGGYVRDRILNNPIKDHDFVVSGGTPELMQSLGFQQVGADFPVYLHPVSGDEFALARTERKSGDGYHGFDVDFNPSTTLEEDLFRRDFTINAMAREVVGWNEHGHAKLSDVVIDPFNGQQDLQDGVIRHVSEHVRDDPVRVLRAARFAARYNFTVHKDTVNILRDVVESGELSHVPGERFWIEFEKAQKVAGFHRFIYHSANLGLQYGLSLVDDICVIPDDLKDLDSRFAASLALQDSWSNVEGVMQLIKAPMSTQKMVKSVWQFARRPIVNFISSPDEIYSWFKEMNVYQDIGFATQVLDVLVSINMLPTPIRDHLVTMMKGCQEIKASTLLTQTQINSMMGKEIGMTVAQARLDYIKHSYLHNRGLK